MKILLPLLIIASATKVAFGIKCLGCEITESGETCDFPYKCPKGIESCETLVSKVNGNYSIVLSCATKEKCSANPIANGLKRCKHSRTDTECYSCCDEDNCNSLEDALEHLPEDLFEVKKSTTTLDKKESDKSLEEEGAEDYVDSEEEEEHDMEEEPVKPKDKTNKLLDLETNEDSGEITADEEEKEKSETGDEVKGVETKSDVENKGDVETVAESDDEDKEDIEIEKVIEEEESDEDDEETVVVGKGYNGANNNTLEIINDVVNETAPEVPFFAPNVTDTFNTTEVTVNKTEEVEETGDNNAFEEMAEPINPNLKAIDEKLNETVGIIKDFAENIDSGDFGIPVNNTNTTESEQDNQLNLEGSEVEGGYEFNASDEESEDKGVNILEHGENAEDESEQHELYQNDSDSSKLSAALLALSFFFIFARLF